MSSSAVLSSLGRIGKIKDLPSRCYLTYLSRRRSLWKANCVTPRSNTVQWKMGKIAASPCQTVSSLMVT